MRGSRVARWDLAGPRASAEQTTETIDYCLGVAAQQAVLDVVQGVEPVAKPYADAFEVRRARERVRRDAHGGQRDAHARVVRVDQERR